MYVENWSYKTCWLQRLHSTYVGNSSYEGFFFAVVAKYVCRKLVVQRVLVTQVAKFVFS